MRKQIILEQPTIFAGMSLYGVAGQIGEKGEGNNAKRSWNRNRTSPAMIMKELGANENKSASTSVSHYRKHDSYCSLLKGNEKEAQNFYSNRILRPT